MGNFRKQLKEWGFSEQEIDFHLETIKFRNPNMPKTIVEKLPESVPFRPEIGEDNLDRKIKPNFIDWMDKYIESNNIPEEAK